MISEGYGTQPFNDFFVDTDKASLEDTLQILASKVMRAADPDGRRFSH